MAKRCSRLAAIIPALVRVISPASCRKSSVALSFAHRQFKNVACATLCLSLTATILLAQTGLGEAETRLAIQTPKRPSFSIQQAGDVGVKLAPELRSSVYANGRFIGVTQSGDAVVDVDAAAVFSLQTKLRTLDLASTQIATTHPVIAITRIIVFAADNSLLNQQTVAGLPIVTRYEPGQFVIVQKQNGEPFSAAELSELAANSQVRYVEPSFPRFLQDSFKIPNDTYYANGTLWGLKNIHAEAIWQKVTESNIKVAVIDTGINLNHPDLRENLTSDGFNVLEPSQPPEDDNGHGSHVAGTIGAVGNNGLGVVGLAWKIKILPIKIFPSSGQRRDTAFDEDVIKAIDYAIGHGAKVINISWAGPNWAFGVKEAITRAETAGTVLVAAASNDYGNDNDNNPRYPASYGNANIISVLSTDQDDRLSDFSNVGKNTVHIGAPGGAIWSAALAGRYEVRSGTSQATPHVAGALAMTWSLPEFSARPLGAIRTLLLANARPLPALAGKCAANGVLDLAFLSAEAAIASSETKMWREEGRVELLSGSGGSAAVVNGRAVKELANDALASILVSLAGERVIIDARK
jgi:thermitase